MLVLKTSVAIPNLSHLVGVNYDLMDTSSAYTYAH